LPKYHQILRHPAFLFSNALAEKNKQGGDACHVIEMRVVALRESPDSRRRRRHMGNRLHKNTIMNGS
jgi:urease accessory protein UreF